MKINIFASIFFSKLIIKLIIICLCIPPKLAHSQAQPINTAANFAANRLIANSVTKVAIRRGFAANDPRIAATMASASSSLTAVNVASSVAGVGLTIAGAPVWMSALVGLGVLAAGTALVVGTTKLLFDPAENKLVVTNLSSDLPPPIYAGGYTSGFSYYFDDFRPWRSFSYSNAEVYRTSQCFSTQLCFSLPLEPAYLPFIRYKPTDAYRFRYSDQGNLEYGPFVVHYRSIEEFKQKHPIWVVSTFYGQSQTGFLEDMQIPVETEAFLKLYDPSVRYKYAWYWFDEPRIETNLAGEVRIAGVVRIRTQAHPTSAPPSDWYSRDVRFETQKFPYAMDGRSVPPINMQSEGTFTFGPEAMPKKFSNLDAAIPRLSMDAGKDVSPEFLAQIVDASWRKAAQQPDYQGLPYTAADPVTAADIVSTGGNLQLQDLLKVPNKPGEQIVPISVGIYAGGGADSGTDTGSGGSRDVNVINNPSVRIDGKVKIDYEGDPSIQPPTLDETPTATSILSPLFDIGRDWRTWNPPIPAGSCPRPTFAFFQEQITMSAHCDLLDSAASIIRPAMILGWSILSIIIILSA